MDESMTTKGSTSSRRLPKFDIKSNLALIIWHFVWPLMDWDSVSCPEGLKVTKSSPKPTFTSCTSYVMQCCTLKWSSKSSPVKWKFQRDFVLFDFRVTTWRKLKMIVFYSTQHGEWWPIGSKLLTNMLSQRMMESTLTKWTNSCRNTGWVVWNVYSWCKMRPKILNSCKT